MLVAAPVAVFAASAVTEAFGPAVAGIALIVGWMAVTAWALNAHSLKDLGDAERPFPIPVPLNDRCCD